MYSFIKSGRRGTWNLIFRFPHLDTTTSVGSRQSAGVAFETINSSFWVMSKKRITNTKSTSLQGEKSSGGAVLSTILRLHQQKFLGGIPQSEKSLGNTEGSRNVSHFLRLQILFVFVGLLGGDVLSFGCMLHSHHREKYRKQNLWENAFTAAAA